MWHFTKELKNNLKSSVVVQPPPISKFDQMSMYNVAVMFFYYTENLPNLLYTSEYGKLSIIHVNLLIKQQRTS